MLLVLVHIYYINFVHLEAWSLYFISQFCFLNIFYECCSTLPSYTMFENPYNLEMPYRWEVENHGICDQCINISSPKNITENTCNQHLKPYQQYASKCTCLSHENDGTNMVLCVKFCLLLHCSNKDLPMLFLQDWHFLFQYFMIRCLLYGIISVFGALLKIATLVRCCSETLFELSDW